MGRQWEAEKALLERVHRLKEEIERVKIEAAAAVRCTAVAQPTSVTDVKHTHDMSCCVQHQEVSARYNFHGAKDKVGMTESAGRRWKNLRGRKLSITQNFVLTLKLSSDASALLCAGAGVRAGARGADQV